MSVCIHITYMYIESYRLPVYGSYACCQSLKSRVLVIVDVLLGIVEVQEEPHLAPHNSELLDSGIFKSWARTQAFMLQTTCWWDAR